MSAETMVPAWLASIESLVASCETAFTSLDLDHPDDVDEDVSIPGIGITFGQIWLARDAINGLKSALNAEESK